MRLLVTADDRTGAYETAAALVDHGAGEVAVVAWPELPAAGGASVIDLGTRHLSPADAAQRSAAMGADHSDGVRHAHKIDSTLRGNWADELVARSTSVSPAVPVLLVPSFPSVGRTCVGGVVLEHGRPVHEGAAGSDVRRRVLTSRPLESLHAAGAGEIVELSDVDQVRAWLADPSGIAVADAGSDATVAEIVAAWDEVDGVLLAGTSVVIGAAVTSLDQPPRPIFPTVSGPILVACGSVHPAARSQLVVAEQHGIIVTYLADDITVRALATADALVLATEIPVGDVNTPLAVAAATTLARGVRELVTRVALGALVVIGGDTAAAVIGRARTVVHGSIGPGTPWVTVEGLDMPVVSRAGGFGSDHALIDLIRRMRE